MPCGWRTEPIFINEWRDASQPYRVGPSIRIDADGQLSANGKPLMTVPIGQWIRLEFSPGWARQATGTYELTVTLPDRPAKKFTDLPVGNPEWRSAALARLHQPGGQEDRDLPRRREARNAAAERFGIDGRKTVEELV